MKTQFIRIGTILVAMCACFAFAQDKNLTSQSTKERIQSNTKPYYKPDKRYSDSEWNRRIREARRVREGRQSRERRTSFKDAVMRRGDKNKSSSFKRAVTRRHSSFKDAVVRRSNPRKRVVVRRHDNGLHKGWYKGKGNPHRTGAKPPFGKAKVTDKSHSHKGKHSGDHKH